ncbi:hypothetical protein BGX23_006031, partial [Mortierella sp. AD031]
KKNHCLSPVPLPTPSPPPEHDIIPDLPPPRAPPVVLPVVPDVDVFSDEPVFPELLPRPLSEFYSDNWHMTNATNFLDPSSAIKSS